MPEKRDMEPLSSKAKNTPCACHKPFFFIFISIEERRAGFLLSTLSSEKGSHFECGTAVGVNPSPSLRRRRRREMSSASSLFFFHLVCEYEHKKKLYLPCCTIYTFFPIECPTFSYLVHYTWASAKYFFSRGPRRPVKLAFLLDGNIEGSGSVTER